MNFFLATNCFPKRNFDAIVVGAGTAGCICSRDLAAGGAKVLVLEEDLAPGKHGKCTSIFSKTGLDSLEVDYSKAVLNEVKGARIHSPNASLDVRAKDTKALVLDRFALDEQCALEAKRAGAKFLFGEKAVSFSRTPGGAIKVETQNALSGKKFSFAAKFLVGADGLSSTVAKEFSFPEIPAKDFVLCYEAEYSPAFVKDEAMVDVFLDAELFKGFFGWIVPCGGGCVRVGFGTSNHALLEWAKKKFFATSKALDFALAHGRAHKGREFVAMIPLRTRSQTQKENVLLVGDAAGQVKATTGGGVVFGGLCARLAAQEILKCLKQGGAGKGGKNGMSGLANGATPEYEKKWRQKYGKTLGVHCFIRDFYDACANWGIDFLVRAGAFLRINKFLEKKGDMDYVLR